jgi:hypothetical protein
MDTNALGRALGSVGQNLGTVANYQASEQRFKDQQTIQDRRDAADKQFRERLQNLEMTNRNQEHAGDMAQNEDHFTRSEAANRDRMGIDQQRADTADKRVGQQMALESERIGLERDRITTGKQDTADTRTANAISSQLKSVATTISGIRKQQQSELSASMKSTDWMMKTDQQKQQTIDAVNSKYQPLLDRANKDYARYGKKFSELTHVDPADPIDMANSVGGDQSMGTGDGAGGSVPGDTSDGANLSPAPASAPAGTGAAPFKEGQRLQGPGGKTFVVRNGVPVPEDQVSAPLGD